MTKKFLESSNYLSDAVCAISEFLEFVMNQDQCRKHWLEVDQQCSELTAQCNELQYENEALKTKLKHARSADYSFLLL